MHVVWRGSHGPARDLKSHKQVERQREFVWVGAIHLIYVLIIKEDERCHWHDGGWLWARGEEKVAGLLPLSSAVFWEWNFLYYHSIPWEADKS